MPGHLSWFTALVVYVLLWWLTLFATLPLWVRHTGAADPASGWQGAPDHPHLWRKALLTTAITTVLWVAVMAVILSPWFSFRSGPLAIPGP